MQIADQVVGLLKEKRLHISTAESCTGGLIAASLVDVPGASEVFEEGYITYSDRVKARVLGVSMETLARYTAVSKDVAIEMAEGAARQSKADITVSVTGYAGPGPAEDGTKAGTVYIGVWYQGKSKCRMFEFAGDRGEVRRQAVGEALSMVLDRLLERLGDSDFE